jgi:hypothetical protein
MKIFVKVKPKAKENKIEKIDENHFKVSVKEPPVGGKANLAVVENLARYFKISKAKIRIVSGQTSRNKIIEILQ